MIEIRLNFKVLIIALLSAAVMSSAIGVINAKHQARTAFVELQALQKVRDDMQVNWPKDCLLLLGQRFGVELACVV